MERDIGVIARVPLDEGGLTGKIDAYTQFEPGDFRAGYFKGDRKKQVAERVAAIQHDLAIRDGALPEVALRFCLSHPAVTSVIPGMRSRANVAFNCSIPGKGPLPEKVLAILKKHAWKRNFYDE
jgi:aryl-alcohol dehydrogenase-like predicted oxidoreductase